jgi:hypothetical protein
MTHQRDHHGNHARHHGVHRQPFGHEGAHQCRPVGATEHVAHKQRLKYEKAEAEAKQIFKYEIEPHGQRKRGGDRRRDDDASRVACQAVDGRAERLFPQGLDKHLMLVRPRLLAGEHVESCAHRSGVEGDQHPPIFHDREFRIPRERVPGHIGDGQPGQGEPDDKGGIDHLSNHLFAGAV